MIAPVEARISDCSLPLQEVRNDRAHSIVYVGGYASVDLARRGQMRIDPTYGVSECRPQPIASTH
ncbi:MAG: hypothetical protein MUF51_07165 [Vicinamibacteria bacterium]|nr:hypothetical protein [Vicinamibacteria bacterium]